jgi:hypothetical protein
MDGKLERGPGHVNLEIQGLTPVMTPVIGYLRFEIGVERDW